VLPGFIFQWSPDFPLDKSSDHRTISIWLIEQKV